jgi:hypothetical protein
MLTLFTTPKPFRGHIEVIQRNAIRSWTLLRPACEIILLGDEQGAAEVASEYRLRHVLDIARNEHGTPLVNDLFEKGQRLAAHDMICYVNCDIILMSDFMNAIERVARLKHRFLMAGQRWNVDVNEPLDFASGWEKEFRSRLTREGHLGHASAIDYFVFSRGLWGEIPPFALGRTKWDNWLLSRALARDAVLIDATQAVMIAHQNHDYSHHPKGHEGIWMGSEARRNLELAGGWVNMSSLQDSTHILTPRGLRFAYERLHLSRYLNALRIVSPSLRLPVHLLLKAIALSRPVRGWARRSASSKGSQHA